MSHSDFFTFPTMLWMQTQKPWAVCENNAPITTFSLFSWVIRFFTWNNHMYQLEVSLSHEWSSNSLFLCYPAGSACFFWFKRKWRVEKGKKKKGKTKEGVKTKIWNKISSHSLLNLVKYNLSLCIIFSHLLKYYLCVYFHQVWATCLSAYCKINLNFSEYEDNS